MHTVFPVQRRSFTAWLTVLLGSALAGALPLIYFRWTLGVWMPEIMPQLSADAHYYLTLIREVLDGHPWLGNPFIREYADAQFPGLLFPMWIGALPGFLGLSINGVFIFNALFWNIVTGALLYALFLRLSGNRRLLAVVATLVGVVSLHNLLIRPIMQVVYPAFAWFLLCLLHILREPHAKRHYVWLGLSATVAFYLYPYLWMTEFGALGLLFCRMLWMRNWPAVRLMALMFLGVALACIPQILTIASLFSDPMASAISMRTGLVETHRVLPLTVFNLKYVILLIAALSLLRARRSWTGSEMLLVLVGSAILLAAFSNVITGKELDLDTHPLWIAYLLNIVAIVVCAQSLRLRRTIAESTLLGGLLLAFVFTTTARIARNAVPYVHARNLVAERSAQEYARIFAFLDETGTHTSVLLAPAAIGNYVPLYTNHYLLYDGWATLHVIPGEELMARWVTQHIDRVDEFFVRNGFGGFAGFGPARAATYQNAYGGQTLPIEFAGGDALVRSTLETHRDVNAHYAEYLRRFHVDYVITDTEALDNPRVPPGAPVAYRDARFAVYELSTEPQ